MKSFPVLLFLSLCLAGSSAFARDAAKPVTVDYDELHTLPLEKVPDRVKVTGLLTTHGNAAAHGFVHLLDRLPENWERVGEGKLSVSEDYSRAGARSIRWDWKAGDLLRIKNAGIVSNVRVGYTGYNARSEEVAPFALSIFQDEALPDNTPLNLYFKRSTDLVNGKSELRLTRMRYFMNFTGTWYKMGGMALRESALLFGQGNYINAIETMPDGIVEPEVDEIVLQAPSNVESGTFYLDRLITLAEVPDRKTMDARAETEYLDLGFSGDGKLVDNRAWPFDLSVEEDVATVGLIEELIDPTEFDQASSAYFGYNAEKPPVPEKLNAEQQAYVDELRASFFVAPESLAPDSESYLEIEKQAKAVLARDCELLEDGRYKFKETINFGGDRIFFAGDRGTARKNVYNFPRSLERNELEDLNVRALFLRYGKWYTLCPDSESVAALFKAYLDWYRYQVSQPLLASLGGTDAAITGHFAKYGGDWLVKYAREMIAVLRSRGSAEDLDYAAYIGEIIVWMSKIQTYTFAVDPLPGISREWSAGTTYDGLFYEPDDAKFYQMLKASQESFTRTFSISEINRRGMIKPDYTFWHHGHCSYWGGNFYAHIEKARQFAHTPLDFSPTIRRTLAWYIPRYAFGAYNFPSTVKGGQESTSGALRFKHWAKERLEQGEERARAEGLDVPTPFSIDTFPRRDVFEYLYEMDWEEVPAARKFMGGVLGMAEHQPEDVRAGLLDEYPKLRSIEAQPTLHLSFNWSGAATYNHGMTRVQVGGYNDKDPTPSRPHGRWSWNRGYGCLYLLDNDRTGSRPPLGADYEGYSWSKAPGVTMPAVTDEEYIKHHTMDGKDKGEHGVELNTAGGAGNGSVTFNETDETFGQYGNYSFQSLKSENLKIWKDLFDIDGVAGRKSYHFIGDRVVCMGSDYQADTDRAMETILFQETLDEVMWKGKNPGRWNPERPTLVLDGESFTGQMQREPTLEETNTLISPYGHAWIIPGEQKGKLKIDWRERETLFNYRIGVTSVTPGQRMTRGTGVIAMLDQGASREVSSHHYFILLNHDGKNPEQLASAVDAAVAEPGYEVLRHDGRAHAVRCEAAGPGPLHSYVVYEGGVDLELPYLASTNRRLNLMLQENEAGEIVMSVADPCVDIENDASSPNHERSRDREIRLVFDFGLKVELLSASSGLPQTNPPLEARMEGNALIYTTRNAVSDTFILRVLDDEGNRPDR